MKLSLAATGPLWEGCIFPTKTAMKWWLKGLRGEGKVAYIPAVIAHLCSPLAAPLAALPSEFIPSFRRSV